MEKKEVKAAKQNPRKILKGATKLNESKLMFKISS